VKRNWTAARAKVADEGRCRRCGTTAYLEAAHVIPRSAVKPGPGEDERNIVPLCAPCHREQHGGRLELLPLLSLSEQGYIAELVGLARALRYTTVEHLGSEVRY
jgi:predicted HNH restriction endonuclease